MASDIQDQEFFNVFDGLDGRPEGSYLDIEERITAEKARALAEDREPDLSNVGKLPGAVGTPLVPEVRRVDNKVMSNPAMLILESKDVDPVSTLGVDVGTADEDVDLSFAAMVADERRSQEDSLSSVDTSGDEVTADTSATANADLTTRDFTV